MENSKTNHISVMFEYVSNKYIPYIASLFIIFTQIGLDLFSFILIGLIIFIDSYSYKLGRSIGEYENNENFKKHIDNQLED